MSILGNHSYTRPPLAPKLIPQNEKENQHPNKSEKDKLRAEKKKQLFLKLQELQKKTATNKTLLHHQQLKIQSLEQQHAQNSLRIQSLEQQHAQTILRMEQQQHTIDQQQRTIEQQQHTIDHLTHLVQQKDLRIQQLEEQK